MKHIKKIEAQPAQKSAQNSLKTLANVDVKTAAPALGGGCIPVGT